MTAHAPAHRAEDVADIAAKPRRWGAWYVAEHQLRGMRAFLATVLATAIGTPFLYLFVFGIGLAALITENRGPEGVDGVGYLQFVAPALLCTAAVLVACEEFMFGILRGFKWNPIFFGMNAAPLTARQIVNGMFLFILIRVAIVVVVYSAIALLFGAVGGPWTPLLLLSAGLTGMAFSPIAAYSASIQDDKGQFSILNRVLILPLTLFSGTMFPLEQLPLPLQWIGWLSPLWHGSELGREISYGPGEPVWLTAIHVVYLVVVAVIGWQLCVRISLRRLNR